ncbi:MAG: hypothetical protein PF445_10315 [Melioribacteraceae bacterium]|jgi:hypothetical protein|nr:hypothetical protein [Melioribacteraceae bacterium]
MTTISKDSIKELYSVNLLYELHIVEEKISLFFSKYKLSFLEFEKKIKSKNESFEEWDDYLEWKGYQKKEKQLKLEKKDLDNGNIKVA